MNFDYSTVEGRVAYRIITSYSNYRASGWSKDRTFDEIRDDLMQLPYKDKNDKKLKEKMATYKEMRQVINNAHRHPCPEDLEKKIIGLLSSLYNNRNLRRKISKEFCNDLDFPLFGEEIYERIERERQRKFRNLRGKTSCF